MLAIRTVLCPVDFSTATQRQLDFTADLCRAFGARVVLHHNLTGAPAGAGVGWMWQGEHPGRIGETQAEELLQRLLADLPDGIEGEARVTHGPRAQSVLAVGEAVAADLVVLTTHGPTSEEHTSIAELLLEHSNRSLLVLHDPDLDREVPHFAAADPTPQRVLVPTSLSPESMPAVFLAFDLARSLPIELHLLHLAPGHPDERSLADSGARLSALVPADLAQRVRLHVEKGEPGEGIASAADRLRAACVVMGEHSHSIFRGWFKRDHTRAVLRRVHCPVWYVPGSAS
jgi:nucleotide-binding universal stress UspA family protein